MLLLLGEEITGNLRTMTEQECRVYRAFGFVRIRRCGYLYCQGVPHARDAISGPAPPGDKSSQLLQFCSLTAASLGLGSAGAKDIATAIQTKPRTPVIWLHGLECTCCTESFIRSYHPVAKDLVLSMISLDYDDTIMAAAGQQAEDALAETMEKYKDNYIVAVEGNVPLYQGGVNCIPGGETFLEKSSTSASTPRL